MPFNPANPLVIQSDKSVLLEVKNDLYAEARDALARFAELEKSPEYLHTYRITPLSLWNAAAAGLSAPEILELLDRYAKYEVPSNVRVDIVETVSRYGRLKITRRGDDLALSSEDRPLLLEIARHKNLAPLFKAQVDANTLLVEAANRGRLKQALLTFGYPAEDLAGYAAGQALSFALRETMLSGNPFEMRLYQRESIDVFHAEGGLRGGSGVIVLPCGAGKTIVGMGVMSALQAYTLILTPSTVAARQWIDELLDKTTLTAEQIGEYTGLEKQVRPVTIATYQILTYRKRKTAAGAPAEFPHFSLFNQADWGLIIYDEVHLLPAPVFRITAELQARRRLGLTATLVREDNRQADVFSLIGPKKFDMPWKQLEKQGWIAEAECYEVRINLPEDDRMGYALATPEEKYRFAAEHRVKFSVLDQILAKHREDNVLIIGMYISQLEAVAKRYDLPLITGSTPVPERQLLLDKFRSGEVRRLVISKVGNFSIDLPEANVAIQISGTFGSRQEEAQRLGRVLRPKRNGLLAHFYSIVARDTVDQDFAANRQLFLTEQGYHYNILYENELADFYPATLSGVARDVTRLGLPAPRDEGAHGTPPQD